LGNFQNVFLNFGLKFGSIEISFFVNEFLYHLYVLCLLLVIAYYIIISKSFFEKTISKPLIKLSQLESFFRAVYLAAFYNESTPQK
jgi:type II secretory pathway component PulF